MNKPGRLSLQQATARMSEIFEAARTQGPQLIEDDGGVFTLTYTSNTAKADAREFLSKGGPLVSE